jgi:multidrug efflux pump subunit AcrA (membrane-fusion protein)
MDMEWWKAFFEIGGVVLLFLTFAFGAGFMLTSKKVNERQAERLRVFDSELTEAKTELSKQQERAAKAEASIALAEQHSAEANAKAEGFRLDIAKANESAAQAQAQVAGATAEAAKANLELAKLKTPRSLSREQQTRVTAAISAFSGTPYDLFVNNDSDSTTLMWQIDASLREAGWEFHSDKVGDILIAGKAGMVSESAVSINFAEEHKETLLAPALALGRALAAEGIQLKGGGVFWVPLGAGDMDKDRTRIHVVIGSKPLN